MASIFAVSLVAVPLFAPRAAISLAAMQAPPPPQDATPPSAPAPAPAPAARVLTLEEASRTALAQQPQVRQAQASTLAAQARADEARAPLLPQVAGSAAYQISTSNYVQRPGAVPNQLVSTQSPTFTTYNYFNFALSANQLIYDFGQTWGRYGAAKSSAEAQAQTERATRFQTLLNVRTAFFQARAQKALVASSRETLANQERHLSQVQGFVELGTRPEIDLAQARTDVANAKLALIQAENNYATARAQLNNAMGAIASSEYEVSDDTLPPIPEEEQPLETLVQLAYATRPELASLAKQIEADQKLVSAARGGYGPTLGASTAFAEAGQRLDNLGWNWNAAITLTWPLFQGMLVPAQVRETQANLAAAEAARDGVELQLRLEVEQARLAVRGAKASLTAAEQVLVNAREQLRLAEGRYRTGVGSIIELSDAQTAVITAESQRVNADFLLSSARAQLMQALGRETL